MGAYLKALHPESKGGLGMSEADAVYFADKTVRNAHGGAGIKDMAAVQRGPELMKLFTMYYTFWNHNYNRIRDTGRALGEAATWKDSDRAGMIIMRSLMYTIGAQAVHGLFKPPKEEDDDHSWLKWFAEEIGAAATAGIPVARDLYAHYVGGRDYTVTPAAAIVDAVGRSGQDAAHAMMGEDVSDKWIKHSLNTTGYVLGLPLGQASNAAQFLWDVQEGAQDPEGVADWYRGLVHGTTKKQ
jgi:hypothetical protein